MTTRQHHLSAQDVEELFLAAQRYAGGTEFLRRLLAAIRPGVHQLLTIDDLRKLYGATKTSADAADLLSFWLATPAAGLLELRFELLAETMSAARDHRLLTPFEARSAWEAGRLRLDDGRLIEISRGDIQPVFLVSDSLTQLARQPDLWATTRTSRG